MTFNAFMILGKLKEHTKRKHLYPYAMQPLTVLIILLPNGLSIYFPFTCNFSVFFLLFWLPCT